MCVNCGPIFGCNKGCPTNPEGKAPTAAEETILRGIGKAGQVSEAVNHPAHYGGKDNQYEVIKVAEAWGFDKDAYLFNVLKYIGRPGKGNFLQDLKKAAWYLDRKIGRLEAEEFEAAKEVNRQQVNKIFGTDNDVPPRIGSEWIWKANDPAAICRVKVVRILGGLASPVNVECQILERGPKAFLNSPGGTYTNPVARFWQAVSPAQEGKGLNVDPRELNQFDVEL